MKEDREGRSGVERKGEEEGRKGKREKRKEGDEGMKEKEGEEGRKEKGESRETRGGRRRRKEGEEEGERRERKDTLRIDREEGILLLDPPHPSFLRGRLKRPLSLQDQQLGEVACDFLPSYLPRAHRGH
jgi:hypothetical protein